MGFTVTGRVGGARWDIPLTEDDDHDVDYSRHGRLSSSQRLPFPVLPFAFCSRRMAFDSSDPTKQTVPDYCRPGL